MYGRVRRHALPWLLSSRHGTILSGVLLNGTLPMSHAPHTSEVSARDVTVSFSITCPVPLLFGGVVLVCLLLGADVALPGQLSQRSSSPHAPRLHAPRPTLLDGFGMAVASAGNRILVGAPHATGRRGQTGKVFLFERESGTLLRELSPPSPIGDDLFGLSVGLTMHHVVVGAPRGKGQQRRSVGSVSVFDLETGAVLRIVTSPGQAPAAFGHAVAVRGRLLAIGDPGAGTATTFDVGEAYLVDILSGEVRRTVTSPHAKTGKPDGFGHAVALPGSVLAVSAPLGGTSPIDHGQVFLFDRESGRLHRVLESPAPQTNAYFGWALAGDEEFLVVGALGQGRMQPEAGAAYLYTSTGQFLRKLEVPSLKKGDHFGEAVAILSESIIVGAPGDDAAGVDAGAVFIFDRATGTMRSKIPNPSTTTGVADLFGHAVSGSGDGIAVGVPYGDLRTMPDAGLVHQFRLPSSREGT